MKKLILIVSFAFVSMCSWAVKAYWQPTLVQQSDGTWLTVTLHGDEDLSWASASDGTILTHVGRDYYVASIGSDGSLLPSSVLAHEPLLRSVAEQKAVAAQSRQLFFSKSTQVRGMMRAKRNLQIGTNAAYFPHEGAPKALVILANFQDVKFTVPDPLKTFSDYLNHDSRPLPDYGRGESANYGSVRKYFSDMSFGKFTPQFDVKGPVTLSQTMSYYGQNSGSRKDIHYTEMIQEACQQVSGDVNFADYDADGDGKVDLVYIIYAGYSESFPQNSSDCLWPKSGTVNFTVGGKQIFRFGINNELNGYPGCYSKAPLQRVNGIGLFCHEFSHTMGLPDLYPTVASAQIDNQGLEYWDLMDGGEYVANGHYPTPYTPWERETMGWMTVDTLSEACQMKLAPVQYGGKAYKIIADGTSKYLLLENLQRAGWYSRLPAQGLMVYKVNYPTSEVNLYDNPNNVAGNPAVTLVPADGRLLSSYSIDKMISAAQNDKTLSEKELAEKLDSLSKLYTADMAGDPFPGSQNVTEMDSVSLGTEILAKPLYNIKMTDDGYVTFDFLKRFPTGIYDVIVDKSVDARIYSIDGRYVGCDASKLRTGVYIRNHRKFVVK